MNQFLHRPRSVVVRRIQPLHLGLGKRSDDSAYSITPVRRPSLRPDVPESIFSARTDGRLPVAGRIYRIFAFDLRRKPPLPNLAGQSVAYLDRYFFD
jgi:hypothetical protein